MSRAGKFAQLLIDERQQFLCGLGVAVLNSFENVGDFAHGGRLLKSSRETTVGWELNSGVRVSWTSKGWIRSFANEKLGPLICGPRQRQLEEKLFAVLVHGCGFPAFFFASYSCQNSTAVLSGRPPFFQSSL